MGGKAKDWGRHKLYAVAKLAAASGAVAPGQIDADAIFVAQVYKPSPAKRAVNRQWMIRIANCKSGKYPTHTASVFKKAHLARKPPPAPAPAPAKQQTEADSADWSVNTLLTLRPLP